MSPLSAPPDLLVAYLAAMATEQDLQLIPADARRPLFPWEQAVDFKGINSAQEDGYAITAASLDKVRDAVLDGMTDALSGDNPGATARDLRHFAARQPKAVRDAIESTTADIEEALDGTFRRGARILATDARAQGVPVPDALSVDPRRGQYREAAATGPAWLWQRLTGAATAAGGPRQPPRSEVLDAAAAVDPAGAYDLARQAVNVAHGEGRTKAVHQLTTPTAIYASELLDTRTCRPCERVDGRHYSSMEEAESDYPGGAGYRSCQGGARCRGSLVYVWEEDEPSDKGLVLPPGVNPSPAKGRSLLPIVGAVLAPLVLPAAVEVAEGVLGRAVIGRTVSHAPTTGARAPWELPARPALELPPAQRVPIAPPYTPPSIGPIATPYTPPPLPAPTRKAPKATWDSERIRDSTPTQLRRAPDAALERAYIEALESGDDDFADHLEGEINDRAEGVVRQQVAMRERAELTYRQQREAFDLINDGMDPYEAMAEVSGKDPTLFRKAELMTEWTAAGDTRTWSEITRQQYYTEAHRHWLDAENATRGHMLSAEAEQRNARALTRGEKQPIDEQALWFSNETTARRWASDELKAWWDEHGRLTYADYEAGLLGGSVGRYLGEDFLR